MFAWPEQRLFPVASEHDAFWSTLYFNKQAEQMPAVSRDAVAQRLCEAVRFWGVTFHRAPMEKQAEAADSPNLAVQYRLPDGTVMHQCKVASAEDFQQVSTDLIEGRHRYPMAMRRDVARQLLAADPALQATTPHGLFVELEKTAGMGTTTVGTLRPALGARLSDYRQGMAHPALPDIEDAYKGLWNLPEQATVPGGMLNKIAEVLDQLDQDCGNLSLGYGQNRLPAPETFCFELTPKMAEALQGQMLPLSGHRMVLRSNIGVSKEALAKALEGITGQRSDDPYLALSALGPAYFEAFRQLHPGAIREN